ncbi:hypothetical protein Rin_00000920, partial [Candidatus Regiella insecticola 5.15]
QAGTDAEKIRKQAYAEGYQQGVITAAKQIKKYINASHALSEKLNIVLVERAKEILSTALDHPDILIILVDEWLRKLDKKSIVNDNLLHLILPLSARKRHVQLLEFLNENWNKPIKIEYHAESRLIIKYVDQIAEFVPDEFIEQGLTRLSLTHDVTKECRTLSQNALQQLSDIFQKSFSAV